MTRTPHRSLRWHCHWLWLIPAACRECVRACTLKLNSTCQNKSLNHCIASSCCPCSPAEKPSEKRECAPVGYFLIVSNFHRKSAQGRCAALLAATGAMWCHRQRQRQRGPTKFMARKVGWGVITQLQFWAVVSGGLSCGAATTTIRRGRKVV